ncbi:hypothetical protein ID866_11008 [Astraeus odoratus]|nr:hypothetical protein ID866_11008 [Astraeus odoratus]
MCKSSTITGALAMKTIDWTEVLDEELATDIDDTDSVGDTKAQEKCRRLCMARDAEIQKAEEARQEVEEQEQKCQVEEAEKCQKEEERRQKEAEAEQKLDECIHMHQVCKTMAELHHTSRCQEKVGVWIMYEGQGEVEHKKWAKKVADNDNGEIVILSSWKTKWQGGGKTLEEISNQRWGELIQAVSTCMDVANGHLEWIASTAQSSSCKMQRHHLLMEGLVGQQQVLLSKLVKIANATWSGGAREVIEDTEEPQEVPGEGSGGQEEEVQGVPGGVPEDALGEELDNGAGPEDGAEKEGQQSKTKGKGKEKAL